MKTKRSVKAVVGAVLLSMSGIAAGVGCPPVIDSIWQAGMDSAQASVEAAITASFESISTSRTLNLQRVLSALRVVTKQISASGEQQIAADIAAKKGSASYLSELSSRKAMFNAMIDYSPSTGQGFDPCGELLRSKNIAVAVGEASRDMQEKVIRELDAAPGRLVRDQAALISQRMAAAKTLYCTPDEAAAGLCKAAGTMAGRDVDATNFFTSHDADSPEGKAKSALLNNMFGVPYQAIPKEMAATASGQSFLEAKRAEDAIGSVSQASMKAIQSWTEGRGTGAAKSDSVLDTLSKKVGTYSGGDNYAAWEKDKLSQSERGLLVEYAKMAATELYMLHAEYQQQERIEANVATLQALRARQTSANGDQFVQSAAARAKVK